MGYLDHVSELCSVTSTRKSKRKNMETVEIKVKMDCDGCERRVKNAASSLKGHLIFLSQSLQIYIMTSLYTDN
ncbi:putative heavy metal-associated domain, HMA, heavy metal-associated domain superfamily [Helianthus annuus]|nr:putative heavy metal-associated domain, HMA, heavy metal-associated domain superfamily [Helianthus annuus]